MGICQRPSASTKRGKVTSRNAERTEERGPQDVDFIRLAQRVDRLEARIELFWQRIQQDNQAVALLQQQNPAPNI